MISKDILKQVLATNQNDIKNYKIVNCLQMTSRVVYL